MWIIKIGGSLQESEHLKPWLDCIAEHGAGRAVLVPGGGRYADAVREAQRRFGFDDAEAHRAAVRAMEKFAAQLCSVAPSLIPARNLDDIARALDNGNAPVWLPAAMVIDNPDLPASWDATSDSLALWLAQQLSAEGLALVKSVRIDDTRPLDDLAQESAIDRFFPELFQKQPVNLAWFTPEQHRQLPDLLEYGVPQVSTAETSSGLHPAANRD